MQAEKDALMKSISDLFPEPVDRNQFMSSLTEFMDGSDFLADSFVELFDTVDPVKKEDLHNSISKMLGSFSDLFSSQKGFAFEDIVSDIEQEIRKLGAVRPPTVHSAAQKPVSNVISSSISSSRPSNDKIEALNHYDTMGKELFNKSTETDRQSRATDESPRRQHRLKLVEGTETPKQSHQRRGRSIGRRNLSPRDVASVV
jgi:hypothetical protein